VTCEPLYLLRTLHPETKVHAVCKPCSGAKPGWLLASAAQALLEEARSILLQMSGLPSPSNGTTESEMLQATNPEVLLPALQRKTTEP
jgi:hypothetical protein